MTFCQDITLSVFFKVVAKPENCFFFCFFYLQIPAEYVIVFLPETREGFFNSLGQCNNMQQILSLSSYREFNRFSSFLH